MYSTYHDSHVDLWTSITLVHNIQAILDSAKETRDEIFAHRTQLRSILHPIRSLPGDILLLIFEWCIISHEHPRKQEYYGSLDYSYPPWQLSHVCRRWRDLVLSSPILWSDIHLCVPSKSHIPREDAIASRLDVFLKRSGQALLAVTINDNGLSIGFFEDNGYAVSLLKVTTDRWRSLCLRADADLGGLYTRVFLGCSFPNLTRIELGFDDLSNAVVTAFRNTPNLRHVHAYNTKLDINWNNIISYRTCSNILSHHSLLPSLQELIVDDSVIDVYEPPDDLPPLALPALHTLQVDMDIEVLHRLSMPCLVTLQIHLSAIPPADYPNLRRWKHLRNLSLHFSGGLPERLVLFLTGAPHITSLDLGDDNLLTTTVLRTNGTEDLFPCLESLGVEVSTLSGEAISEVQAIVESRFNGPGAKIQALRMDLERFYRDNSSDVLTVWEVTFERLCSLGVKVISTDYVSEF